jgi:hypothetical protein
MVAMAAASLPKGYLPESPGYRPTPAEKIIDGLIYWGNNYGLNYLLSLTASDIFLGYKKYGGTDLATGKPNGEPVSTIAVWANEGPLKNLKVRDIEIGKTMGQLLGEFCDICYIGYNKLRQDALHDGLFKGVKNHEARNKMSGTIANILTLSIGGWITAVNVKLMEDRKVPWLRRMDAFLDKRAGRVLTQQQREERELRYKVIEITQHKSWGRILGSRVAGQVALNTFFPLFEWIDEKFVDQKLPEKYQAGPGRAGFRRGSDWTGKRIETLVEDFEAGRVANGRRGAKPMSDEAKTRVKYWAELLQFEAMCVLVTSGVMEIAAKFGLHNKKKEEKVATLINEHNAKWNCDPVSSKTGTNSSSDVLPPIAAEVKDASPKEKEWTKSTPQRDGHYVPTQSQSAGYSYGAN